MPCRSEPPTREELEEARLHAFLDEIGDTFQGRHHTIDSMAQTLCGWCQAHDVKAQSLELQIWWRDHQLWDAKRKADEAAEAERKRLKAQALKKLTPAEIKALRLR